MAEPATPDAAAPATPHWRAGSPGDDAALASLARAGVATHAIGFDAPGGASLTDEARALEALAGLVEGQIFRLGPLRYAVRLAGDTAAGEALASALAAALGGAAAQVARLDAEAAPDDRTPDGASTEDDARAGAAALLQAFAAPAAPVLRVLDAGAALAAADLAARRIAAISAGPFADPETAARLERVEAALARLDARAAPEIDLDALADALAARLPPAPAAELAPRIEALERRLVAVDASLERLHAAVTAALPARDGEDGMRAALEELRALRVVGSDEMSALLAQVRALAERPVAAIDALPEREAPSRLTATLQAMLDRLDAEASRPGAAAREGEAERLAEALGDRLDALQALIGAADARPAIDALRETMARLAVAPAAPDPDLATRLAAVEAALDRLAAASQGADAAGLQGQLRDALRALAERPAPTPDLRAEREGLHRAVFALQTLMARIEAELARLGAGEDSLTARLDALTAALEPLSHAAQTLEQTRDAALLGAEQAGATVEVAQAARAACGALLGLRARCLDAGAAAPGALDEAMVERIGATLAEFLAQLQRAATRAPQSPLRIGRRQ